MGPVPGIRADSDARHWVPNVTSSASDGIGVVDARGTLTVGDESFEIFRLDALQERWDVARLPYTLRVLLENVLRAGERRGREAVAGWVATDEPSREISFRPSRVLHQDFTGVPAIVDLAAMRNAMQDLGGDAGQINPVIPAELVIDHSVQVDEFATRARVRPQRRARVRAKPRALRLPALGPGRVRRLQGRPARHRDRPPGQPRVPRARRRVARRAGVPRHAGRHRLAHDDGQRARRPRLGRRRDRGRGGDARRGALDARSAGGRLPADRRAPGGCDRDRPRPDGDRDPAQDRRRRQVRRVLRPRPRRRSPSPTARRSGTCRPSTARPAASSRSTTRRSSTCGSPAGPRSGSRSSRPTARRTCSGTTPTTTRPTRRSSSSTWRRSSRSSPGRGARRTGCRSARRKRAFLERAAELRRRLRERQGRGGRRELPGLRPARARRARPRRAGGAAGSSVEVAEPSRATGWSPATPSSSSTTAAS